MRPTARSALRAAAAALLCIAARAAPCQGTALAGPGGAPPAFPELRPSERFVALGSLPDPLSLPRLVEAGFLCSGVAPERIASYAERVDGLIAQAREALGPPAGAAPGSAAASGARSAVLGEALLDFLHARVFRSYAEGATTLDGVLDAGRYNCVSSALLYMIMAEALGLEVEGSRTSDHALCVLVAGSRRIDVETTNPYGFDPGTKKEFKDSFGKTTGYAYSAPGAYSGRKALGGRGMAGLILSNRASVLEREGRFREALALGAGYYAMCRDADSGTFLADRVNNVAAYLWSRGDLAGAEELAFEAAALMPGDAELSRLAGRALEALAADLASRGEYELARRAAEARRGAADAAAVARALASVGDAELARAANSLPFAEAIAAADRLLAAAQVSRERYAQAVAAAYGREAVRLGNAGDWLAGAALAEEGAAKAPGDGSLARMAASMRRNFVVVSHNAFAALYNAGDYAGASAAAEAALLSAPGDATLLGDLEAAEAARARASGQGPRAGR